MIVEQGRNFPALLKFINKVPATVRSGGIGDQAMALVRGETPVHLAQRFRGQSQLRGPSQLPSRVSIETMFPQMANRPTPVKDVLRKRGLLGQSYAWPFGQTERNIPHIYERFGNLPTNVGHDRGRPSLWPVDANIGSIPSVAGIVSGPSRTVHSQMSVSM